MIVIEDILCRCATVLGGEPHEQRHLNFYGPFFSQAEDGIRDPLVTGVQTCALPICNAVQALLEQGVSVADPARCDVRGNLGCGRDVTIDINCIFEGDVRLGDQVAVGANCVLKNARIAAGTRIEPFCHIEDADIGANCRIGPYARIRPGTRLASDVHLGNFVEVKASSVGEGSKANHLAYIGDSEIGRNVNVGAGTITCNYDGANKHRTIIEDDVSIGSDTQLVAPVRVGKGATLGAGTTLTKDAPPGELTLSRVKQTTVPGWTRPKKKEEN